MDWIAIQRALWVAGLVAELIAICALVRYRLIKKFPFFVLYLGADLIWGLALIQIDFRTVAYVLGYRLYLITICVLRLGVAGELYERICEHFQGIGVFRVWLIAVLLALSAVLSLGTFWPGVIWGFPESFAIVFERFETAALFGTFVLTRFFLHNFLRARPPIRPNVLYHWLLLTVYFGIGAVSYAASQSVRPGIAVVRINLFMLTADLVCMLSWARLLRPKGEFVPDFYRWSPEGDARRAQLRKDLLDLVEKARDDLFHGR